MKRFELWEFDNKTEELNELSIVKTFFNVLKKTIQRVMTKGISLYKRVKPGKMVVMKFSLPKTLSESANTGKAGGELAEVALLDKLHDLLVKYLSSKEVGLSRQEAKERVYFNNRVDKNTWYSMAYKQADSTYNSSVKNARDRKEKSVWISHGHSGAQLIFQSLKEKFDPDYFYITDFRLDHEGQTEIGKTKKDFSVKLIKHDTNRLRRTLGFSMKASADKSPYETPPQAYQTGYAAIVISLITGKYTKEMADLGDIKSYSRAINELEKIKDPDKRLEQLEKIKASYEKSYLYELDKLGSKMGYGTSSLKNNELPNLSARSLLLGQYLDAISRSFKDDKKERKRIKRETGVSVKATDQFVINVNDYISIIEDVLEQRIKKDKQGIIKAVLKFGGIEKDLYYLAAGVAPGDKEGSAAVTTLFDDNYEKMTKELLNTQLDMTVERVAGGGGKDNLMIRIHRKDGTTLVRFKLYKEHQDVRISLPAFSHDAEEEKIDTGYKTPGGKAKMQTVDQSKLLRKYATNKYNIE